MLLLGGVRGRWSTLYILNTANILICVIPTLQKYLKMIKNTILIHAIAYLYKNWDCVYFGSDVLQQKRLKICNFLSL